MPFYYDIDADRLPLPPRDLELVNDALRKERLLANPLALHGNARTWYSRIFRLNKVLAETLPDRFNTFRPNKDATDQRTYSVFMVTRLEPPYVRAVIQREGDGRTEVSLPLLTLELAVSRLMDAFETGVLDDKTPGSVRHRLDSQNTASVLRQHAPQV